MTGNLAVHPGPVVISNAGKQQVVDLYRGLGFDVVEVVGMARYEAPEILATKNL